MVPKVAKRGHSFKGAGLYYLHDKANDNGEKVATTDRVDWTHVHNVPTNDPEKAMRYMAYMSMNAEQIKHNAGVSKTGRKTTAGSVYSFSLAWHTEQIPEKDHMLDVSMTVLERLGLKDNHQAVIVAHKEPGKHDHVHVICNLVNMETGKTVSMSNDRLILSKWAQEYELEHGVYCEQRIDNNKKRDELAKAKKARQEQQQNFKDGKTKDKPETGIVKHREKKIDKSQIQNLYQQADSAQAFQAALKMEGYELAKGDRRGLVLVDDTGKVHSLSRQMKGLWTKDKSTGKWNGGLEKRFKDFDQKSLRPAKEVIEDKQYFDRDKQNQEQQERIDQAGIDAQKTMEQGRGQEKDKTPLDTVQDSKPPKSARKKAIVDPAYKKLDREQKQQREIDYWMAKHEQEANKAYDIETSKKHLQKLRAELAKTKRTNILGGIRKEYSDLETKIDGEQATHDNMMMRRAEFISAKRKEVESKIPEQEHQTPANDQPAINLEAERQKRIAEIEAKMLEDLDKEWNRERDDGFDLER